MGPRDRTIGSRDPTGQDALGATTAVDSPPPIESIPERVGRYHVESRIGAGAMGVVLRARDPSLDRVVAIKLLHGKIGHTSGTQQMLREAQALAKLSHPHVIDVFDVGMVDDRGFIAMEYVAGQTLDAWIEHARPPQPAVVDAFVHAGQGLAAAHEAGLVHRDFKPANVMRGDDGRVRVLDFGLAVPPRESEARTTLSETGAEAGAEPRDPRLTATGFVVGTPAYMAPEAHFGELVDARSDQFSFCVSLFEALWGQRPFPGSVVERIAAQKVEGKVVIPPGVEVPAPIQEAVLRGLRSSPGERWPSMEALLEHLQPRRRSKWPWLLASGAAVVVAVVAARPRTSPCQEAPSAVEAIWNDDARSRTHEAFGRSALPYAEDAWQRVHTGLDTYAEALADARLRACNARLNAGAEPEQIDRRAACLDRHQAQLAAVAGVLEHADADAVRNANRLLSTLDDLQDCDDPPTSKIEPPSSLASDVQQVHAELARARAETHAGHYEQGVTLTRTVLEHAEAVGHAPLVAEVRYELSRALESDGKYEPALEQMTEAWMEAQGSSHDRLAAHASTQLIFVTGNLLRRPEDAERWVRHARAAVGRLPEPGDLQTFLLSTLGNFYWARGELDAAREHFERALAIYEGDTGAHRPTALLTRSNLAMVRHELGDHTQARAFAEQVLAGRIEVFGPSHPIIASSYANLAVIEQVMGELDAAVEHTAMAIEQVGTSMGTDHPFYGQLLINQSNNEFLRGNRQESIRLQEQARDSLVASVGPRAFLVGRCLNNLGAFYHEDGRDELARQTLTQALDILQEHLPPGHPELASATTNIANIDLKEGRLDQALAGFEGAVTTVEESLGKDHPRLVSPLIRRAQVYVELERHDDALADLRRASTLALDSEADPEQRAFRHHEIGELLSTLGRDHDAREQMERARALLDTAASDEDELRTTIDAWLREHAADAP